MKIAVPAGCARFSVLRGLIASARRSIGFSLVLALSVFTAQRAEATQLLPNVHGYGLERSAGTDPNTAGFGSNAVIIEVTNLSNDNIAGSLRRALQDPTSPAGVPRIVVFKTSGVIDLKTQVEILHHNTTIAGQTAPYPGIALHGAPLIVKANNVLVQHLRVRPGEKWYNANIAQNLTQNRDAAQLSTGTISVRNVVFDHCTFGWSLDECVSAYNGYNKVTFNKCLFAEPLDLSTHMDENIFQPNYPQQAESLPATYNSASGTPTPLTGTAMSDSYHLINSNLTGDWVEYTLNIERSDKHDGCYIAITGITGPTRGQFRMYVYDGAGTTPIQTSAVYSMHATTVGQKEFIARTGTPFNIPNSEDPNPAKTYRVRVQVTGAGAGGGYTLGIDNIYIAQNHAMGPYFTDGFTNAYGPDKTASDSALKTGGKLTLTGNAFAHLQARGPWSGAQDFYFVNNVLYNRKQHMLMLGVASTYKAMRAAVIGNTFIEGPSWDGPNAATPGSQNNTPIRRTTNHTAGMNLYVNSNTYHDGDSANAWNTYNSTSSASDGTWRGDGLPSGHTPLSASAAYADVLMTAGARPLERDDMEQRIFEEISAAPTIASRASRPGSLKSFVSEAGGFPDYTPNHPSTWVLPSSPNSDADADGYTNIEEWLHGFSQALVDGTQQGEVATFSGGALAAADVTGYRATGFVNFAVGSTATPSVATYTNVAGKSGGAKVMTIRFSNGSASARTGQLVVNGGTPISVTFPTTGSFSSWSTINVNVTMNAGHNNTVSFRAIGQDLGNIDEFTIL